MTDDTLDRDLVSETIVLEEAGRGKRVANFLIDYVALFIILIFVFSAVSITSPNILLEMQTGIGNFIGFLAYFLYYIISEWGLKGRTIGKYITKTKVVMTETGETPDFNTILRRSLSRLVPFEPFSFLGSRDGWHDRWTGTSVVEV